MNNFFCRPCIAAEPTTQFVIWATLLLAGAIFALYRAYKNFKKSRLIEDMPTSLIRSASQGFTELIGIGKTHGEHLSAPLSASPCLWWYYAIEQYKSSGKSSSWVTLESGTSKQPFNIDDASGLCLVMPEGADLTARHHKQWRGRQRHPLGQPMTNTGGTLRRLLTTNIGFGARYRYTERLIKEHDPLYILGHFSTDSTGKRSLSIKKMTGNILRSWKGDFAALLGKYDSNGDGELDIAEWKDVQQAARKEALKQQHENSRQDKEHAITKPADSGLPFLIGSQEQDALSGRYRWRAIGFSLAFLLAGAAATWYISARFSSGL
ncbi:MAG: hypothetical protein KBT88_15250 [Gammaproteobacteria bacterium]|nr:hypothetical protein [Gammaproteobacteria bacterium]MBQ0841137.1 hypothetical protein [Gammaproteobacteria bacterium]